MNRKNRTLNKNTRKRRTLNKGKRNIRKRTPRKRKNNKIKKYILSGGGDVRSDNFDELLKNNDGFDKIKEEKDRIFYRIGYYQLYDSFSDLLNQYNKEEVEELLPKVSTDFDDVNKEKALSIMTLDTDYILNIYKKKDDNVSNYPDYTPEKERSIKNEIILMMTEQIYIPRIIEQHNSDIEFFNTLTEDQKKLNVIKKPDDTLNNYEEYVNNKYKIEVLRQKLLMEHRQVMLSLELENLDKSEKCDGETPEDVLDIFKDNTRMDAMTLDQRTKFKFNKIKELVNDKKLVRIETSGNGNCGYHAVLYGIINHYNNNNPKMDNARKDKFNEFFSYVLPGEIIREINYSNRKYQDPHGQLCFNDKTIFLFRLYMLYELEDAQHQERPIFEAIDKVDKVDDDEDEEYAKKVINYINDNMWETGETNYPKKPFNELDDNNIKDVTFIIKNRASLQKRLKKKNHLDLVGYHDQSYDTSMYGGQGNFTRDQYIEIFGKWFYNLRTLNQIRDGNDIYKNIISDSAGEIATKDIIAKLKLMINIDVGDRAGPDDIKYIVGYKDGEDEYSDDRDISNMTGYKSSNLRGNLLNKSPNGLPRGEEKIGPSSSNWMDLQAGFLLVDISRYLNIVIVLYVTGTNENTSIIDPISTQNEDKFSEYDDPIFIQKSNAHFTFLENRCHKKERIKKNLKNLEKQYKEKFKVKANDDASKMGDAYDPDTEGGKFEVKNSKFIERLIEWYGSKIKIIFSHGTYSYDQIIHSTDYNFMENSHNYIQWLFPTDSESDFKSKRSPIINKGTIKDIPLDKILVSLNTYKNFLIEHADKKGIDWKDDHNNLRISRVIQCLKLFKLEDQAIEFYEFIRELLKKKRVNPDSVEKWLENLDIPKYNNPITIKKEKEYIGNPQNDEDSERRSREAASKLQAQFDREAREAREAKEKAAREAREAREAKEKAALAAKVTGDKQLSLFEKEEQVFDALMGSTKEKKEKKEKSKKPIQMKKGEIENFLTRERKGNFVKKVNGEGFKTVLEKYNDMTNLKYKELDYQYQMLKLYKDVFDKSLKDGKYKDNYKIILETMDKNPDLYLKIINPNEQNKALATHYHNYLSVLNNSLLNMPTEAVGGDSNLQYGGTINIDELNALDLDERLNKLKNSLITHITNVRDDLEKEKEKFTEYKQLYEIILNDSGEINKINSEDANEIGYKNAFKLHSLYLNLQLRKIYLNYIRKKIKKKKEEMINNLIKTNDNNIKLYEDIFINNGKKGDVRNLYIAMVSGDESDGPSMLELEIYTARINPEYLNYLKDLPEETDTVKFIIKSAEEFKSDDGDILKTLK